MSLSEGSCGFLLTPESLPDGDDLHVAVAGVVRPADEADAAVDAVEPARTLGGLRHVAARRLRPRQVGLAASLSRSMLNCTSSSRTRRTSLSLPGLGEGADSWSCALRGPCDGFSLPMGTSSSSVGGLLRGASPRRTSGSLSRPRLRASPRCPGGGTASCRGPGRRGSSSSWPSRAVRRRRAGASWPLLPASNIAAWLGLPGSVPGCEGGRASCTTGRTHPCISLIDCKRFRGECKSRGVGAVREEARSWGARAGVAVGARREPGALATACAPPYPGANAPARQVHSGSRSPARVELPAARSGRSARTSSAGSGSSSTGSLTSTSSRCSVSRMRMMRASSGVRVPEDREGRVEDFAVGVEVDRQERPVGVAGRQAVDDRGAVVHAP